MLVARGQNLVFGFVPGNLRSSWFLELAAPAVVAHIWWLVYRGSYMVAHNAVNYFFGATITLHGLSVLDFAF